MKVLISLLAILLLAFALGCGGGADEEAEPEPEATAEQPEVAEPAEETAVMEPVTAVGEIPQVEGDTVTTESGLRYIDVTVGEGASPAQGQVCVAHYTGWLTDGTKFDSSHDRGQPMQFTVGRMIPGFDEGVKGMKAGGRRLLIIPGQLGYGPRGNPRAGIGPNATLVFDVELIEVK